MKIVIDMNLSPKWVPVLKSAGHEPTHWIEVGPPNATDKAIMEWAKANNHIVFSHDLDFGAILAATKADSPSVFQIRTQDISIAAISNLVLSLLTQFERELDEGALISVNENQSRVRILTIKR